MPADIAQFCNLGFDYDKAFDRVEKIPACFDDDNSFCWQRFENYTDNMLVHYLSTVISFPVNELIQKISFYYAAPEVKALLEVNRENNFLLCAKLSFT